MIYNVLFLIVIAFIVSTKAFHHSHGVRGHSKPMRLNMIFNFFNKKPTTTTNTAASAPSKPKAAVKASSSTTTAPATTNSRYSRFGEYIPAGVSKEQYEAAKQAEARKKEENKKRFEKGKVTESLTEWIVKNEEKGLTGVELNRKGHRMLKMKYEGWYTDESPV